MPLPVSLQPNIVSIYGMASIYGIRVGGSNYRFGVVNQIYGEGDLVGRSVMFKMSNNVQVRYSNTPYFLIPQDDIVFIENEL